MNKFLKSRLGDSCIISGVSLLLGNLLLYWISTIIPQSHEEDLQKCIFILNYGSCIVYSLVLFIAYRRRKPYRITRHTILLLMFLVSCFALNRMLPIFNESTTWLSIALLLAGANMLAFHCWNALPVWAQRIITFTMGVGFVLWIYFALCLVPFYAISIIGLLVLGISIHSFIPALLAIHTLRLIWKTANTVRRGWAFFGSGIATAMLIVIVYTSCFYSEVQRLNHIYNRTAAEGSGSLPTWMEAMQRTNGSFMEDKVLKSDLAYFAFYEFSFFPEGLNRAFRDMPRCHDPLVAVATGISPKLQASAEDRMHILASLHNHRHDALERFWTGKDLSTQYVNTRVKIWPEHHLAYTEKMLTIVCNDDRWSEEAIYTFHLPEGGIVTSLSLWVNGKEEKAILTTKEKADTAYRQIVGYQRRDPSLVQWQEGNTVSVRVFPVGRNNPRRFRIGFTTPLLKDDNKKLRYDNISFEGPSPDGATEDVTWQLNGQPETASTRTYKEDWNLRIEDRPIATDSFTFNGYGYTMREYTPEREAVRTDKVYLDINAAWSDKEVDEVMALVGARPMYVWLRDEMVKLEKDNKANCVRYLRKQRFSLFPIHWISDPAHALLITKNLPDSPSLDDLKDSEFHNKLSAYLKTPDLPKLRLLNIGGNLSPYLRSLKEFRVFRYEQGGTLLLKVLMDNNTFAKDIENGNNIVIDQAGLMITKTPADSANVPSKAPDHLLRLFNYNHIMQQAGKGLITGSAGQDSLVAAAKEAYVVSPVSSLIVLETQQDYNRYDIKDDGNSLKNASMKSKGAVPEPHEWALIILVLLTLLYVKFRNALWNSVRA